MARITLRQLLDDAAEHGYGVPAFDIDTMEQVLPIMQAAQATDSPVILQASRGARSECDPRRFMAPALDGLRKLGAERFEQFGTAGHASRIRPIPLDTMARRYAAGSLAPRRAVAHGGWA